MNSDGGCTCPGDFSKAFGAGTDFVMAGGLFAAHDESGGELETDEAGNQFKVFYGMSSAVAMNKHSGGVANYRAAEGKAVRLPYRGPVANTIGDILGGLRSSCTYVGARYSKESHFLYICALISQFFVLSASSRSCPRGPHSSASHSSSMRSLDLVMKRAALAASALLRSRARKSNTLSVELG